MWEWQLSDSEVADVREQGDGVTLRFSALVARALGTDDGQTVSDWGYALGVELHLAHVRWAVRDAHALGRIAEGNIALHGTPAGPLRLPATQAGALGLALRFANGAVLEGAAQAWSCRFVDGPQFRESYAC